MINRFLINLRSLDKAANAPWNSDAYHFTLSSPNLRLDDRLGNIGEPLDYGFGSDDAHADDSGSPGEVDIYVIDLERSQSLEDTPSPSPTV